MNERLASLDETLATAVAGSLENMVFAPVTGSRVVWSRLAFKEPLQGALLLVMPWELAQSLTCGVYNQEEEASAQVVSDCVSEIGNTIAGQLLESLVPERVFSLGLPESGQGFSFPAAEGMRFWHFKVDDKVFLLGLKLD